MKEDCSFSTLLFRIMQGLSEEVNQMKRERQRKDPRIFDEEGPSTSYQHEKQLEKQRASHHSTRSTFFDKREDWSEYEGDLGHETLSKYFSEYKSQPRALKENLTLQHFLQLKEERRSQRSNRRKRHRFFFPTFDGSSTTTLRAWRE